MHSFYSVALRNKLFGVCLLLVVCCCLMFGVPCLMSVVCLSLLFVVFCSLLLVAQSVSFVVCCSLFVGCQKCVLIETFFGFFPSSHPSISAQERAPTVNIRRVETMEVGRDLQQICNENENKGILSRLSTFIYKLWDYGTVLFNYTPHLAKVNFELNEAYGGSIQDLTRTSPLLPHLLRDRLPYG